MESSTWYIELLFEEEGDEVKKMKSVSKHLHHDHIDLLLFFLLSYSITWTLGIIAIIVGLPIMIAEVFAIPGPFISAILVITYREGKQENTIMD